MEGQRIAHLVVLAFSHVRKLSRMSYWLCKCDCGKEKILNGAEIRRGKIQSCGCLHKKVKTTHGMTFSVEFETFCRMKQRCTNPKKDGYKYYGGRGIKFLFHSFEQFYNEVGARPSSKHSIDRINNNGNYEPGNVRWVTSKEQANNRNPKGSY